MLFLALIPECVVARGIGQEELRRSAAERLELLNQRWEPSVEVECGRRGQPTTEHFRDLKTVTPPRMSELRCPACSATHWVIDSDFRFTTGEDQPYEARPYRCPECGQLQIGCEVLLQAPPEFFMQPDNMYPMSLEEFGRWLRVFVEHFPEDTDRLKRLGLDWYPTALGFIRDLQLQRGEEPDVDWCRAQILAAAGISLP